MALYDDLKAAGVPLGNRESDLHAKVTDESRRIILALSHEDRQQITVFVSQVDGRPWYDIPFAYLPWRNAR